MKVTLRIAGTEPVPTPEPPADLTDFVMRQYHWRSNAQGYHEVIHTRSGRVVLSGHNKADVNMNLGAFVVEKVKELARAHGLLTDFGFRIEDPVESLT